MNELWYEIGMLDVIIIIIIIEEKEKEKEY